MKKIIFFTSILLLPNVLWGQNIYTAIHLNDKEDIRNKNAKEINELNIFYFSGGKKEKKNKKVLNKQNSVLLEERVENGKLTARLSYEYDSLTHLETSRTFERWHDKLGYSKETAKYLYDKNNFLIGIVDYNAKGIKFRETKIENDSIGSPIFLIVLDGNGAAYGGYEKASYNYSKNEVVTSICKLNHEVLQTDTSSIYHNHKDPSDTYNKFGDCIKSYYSDTEYTEYEYEYDDFGNWLTMKIFEVKINKRGKPKRKIDRIFTREIKYWE